MSLRAKPGIHEERGFEGYGRAIPLVTERPQMPQAQLPTWLQSSQPCLAPLRQLPPALILCSPWHLLRVRLCAWAEHSETAMFPPSWWSKQQGSVRMEGLGPYHTRALWAIVNFLVVQVPYLNSYF